jgi:hypothetical protein
VEAGRYDDACPKLEAASKLYTSAGVLFNLADCYEHLGRTASAWATFGEAVSVAVKTNRGDVAQQAKVRQADIEPRLCKLEVVVVRPAAGLVVERDGAELPRSSWNVPTPIDPGAHEVRAYAPSRQSWAKKVLVSTQGQSLRVEISELPAVQTGETPRAGAIASKPSGDGIQEGGPPATALVGGGEGSLRKEGGEEHKNFPLKPEWAWIAGDVGAAYTSMDSLSSSNLALHNTTSSGLAFAVGAGLRLADFTLGLRVRGLELTDFNLWEIDGEVAFHIRMEHFDAHLGARGGYALTGTLSSDAVLSAGGSPSAASANGVNAGVILGFDHYFSRSLSVGVDGSPEFLFLRRPSLPLPPGVSLSSLTPDQQTLYKESGSSVGFGLSALVRLGIHF